MRIQNTCYNNSFQANINSPRLRFKQADFFVKIRGYGSNTRWAKKTKETADTADAEEAVEEVIKEEKEDEDTEEE